MNEAYEQALEKHWEGVCAEARDLPAIREQEAYWKRKEDEYEAYLNDLHRRQQDPDYIASCKAWLDETETLFTNEKETQSVVEREQHDPPRTQKMVR